MTTEKTGGAAAGPAAADPGTGPPALRLTGVGKDFGRIRAVHEVSLEVRRNEVLGLIGENGAGKSTLLKILTGIHRPDRGSMEVDGREAVFTRPQDAAAAGIGVVHQEQSLFTNLSVAENIMLNAAGPDGGAVRHGLYRWGRLYRDAERTLRRVGATVDPRAVVGELSFVERQMVEIARALRVDEQVHATPLVVLDEPTSVLERTETAILEREIRDLREIGSVIFVSHRLDEVLRICDRVVVMREGGIVAERATAEVTEDELFTLMIGHGTRAEGRVPGRSRDGAEPVLALDGLCRRGTFRDVTFSLGAGRTLAIVGTNGSGREAVCRAVFGAEGHDGGTLRVGGRAVRSWSMPRAVRAGIGYVPSERRVEGMVGGLDAAQNLTLAHPGPSRSGPFLSGRRRSRIAADWFARLGVRPADPGLDLARFSGGNQQKVVLAKWLLDPGLRVLVLDHPLRGLDPGAAETVVEQIRAARDRGVAVVLLADTLDEALRMGDDVLVMRDGEVTARFDLDVDSPTSIDLLEKMV